jgi:hypothetical protein
MQSNTFNDGEREARMIKIWKRLIMSSFCILIEGESKSKEKNTPIFSNSIFNEGTQLN